MPSIDVDGAVIQFRQAGEGPPVVLLHASSSHGGQWKPLMERLADRFTVLAPDLHGYGRSDPLPRGSEPCVRRDAAIAHALIDRFGAPARLVGHSLGGAVAAHVAVARPEAVRSLALFEPVLFNLIEEAGDPAVCEYHALASSMTAMLRFGREEAAARAFLDYWIGPGALDAMDEEARAYVVRTIGRVGDDWCGISAHAPGALRAADFAALAMPCLLLGGEATRATTRAILAILRRVLPHAESAGIPRAGHMAPVTHAGRVDPLIEDFLRRHG